MKTWIVILIAICWSFVTLAQPPNISDKAAERAKLQQLKRSYLNNYLQLSENQTEKFWTIYNDFEEKRVALRARQGFLRQGIESKEEKEMDLDIEKLFTIRQEELDLERSFVKDLRGVLTIRQIVAMFRAEREFKKELLQKFGEKNDD